MLKETAILIFLLAFLAIMARVYMAPSSPEIEVGVCPSRERISEGEFLSAVRGKCEGRYIADFYKDLKDMDYFLDKDCRPPREAMSTDMLIANSSVILPGDVLEIKAFGKAVIVCIH